MQVKRQRPEYLSETQISDLFIKDHMPRLSGEAVKVYLYLLLRSKQGQASFDRKELDRYLGLPSEQSASALTELIQSHLIRLHDEQIHLLDLQMEALRAELEAKPKRQLAPDVLNAREAVIRQINDTFFQGVMPLYFYQRIDEYFNHYQFEPDVLYALFGEVSRYQKFSGPGYADEVAATWSRQGVQSFEDLQRYMQGREGLKRLEQHVRKKMNMRQALSSYQVELLRGWMEARFSMELIDEALSRTTAIANPNLRYVDSILRAWQAAKVEDLDGVKRQDAKRKRPQTKAAVLERSIPSGAYGQVNETLRLAQKYKEEE